MREATDLGVSAGVRRELSGRRIDLTKLKFPVKNGVITIQGELNFVGVSKTVEETAIELKFLESSLTAINGAKEVKFELSNWKLNDAGVWESTETKSSGNKAPVTTNGGMVCPDCDYVIRFCPCCGKQLAGAGKGSPSKARKTIPPIKAMPRKKRPLSISPVKPKDKPVAEPSKPVAKPASLTNPAVKPAVAPQAPVQPNEPAMPAMPATPQAPVQPVADNDFPDLNIDLPPLKTQPQEKPAADKKAEPQVPDLNDIDLSDFTLEDDPKPKASQPAEPAFAAPSAPAPAPATPSGAPSSSVPSAVPTEPVAPAATPAPPAAAPIAPASPKPAQAEPPAATPTPAAPPAEPASPPIPDSLDLDAFTDDDTPLPPLRPQSPPQQAQPAMPQQAPAAPAAPAAPTPDKPAEDEDPLASLNLGAPAAANDDFSLDDDDTPLPPLKPKEPEAPAASKDPFAALFSDGALDADEPQGQQSKSKDPFASLDLDLDVLEVFPSGDSGNNAAPPAEQPSQPAPDKPADNNPFNFDNVIDLDSPIDDNKKGKDEKDPFNLDDFDISKFKV